MPDKTIVDMSNMEDGLSDTCEAAAKTAPHAHGHSMRSCSSLSDAMFWPGSSAYPSMTGFGSTGV